MDFCYRSFDVRSIHTVTSVSIKLLACREINRTYSVFLANTIIIGTQFSNIIKIKSIISILK